MKSILAFTFLVTCSYLAKAQVGNGPNGGNGSGSDAGKSYSNGAIPNPNEQTQNRPDSSLRSNDTTYMHQQWNGTPEKQKPVQPKRKSNATSTRKAGTITKKQK